MSQLASRNWLLSPWGILVVALALSVGWGIRGNYGHEMGAAFPGVIAAIAACVISGREDWRSRVLYFALFGGIGWAFGGSISYMQVIGYTHSGEQASQVYGFFGLFLIGFLWAGLGGGSTALPAVLDRKRLTDLCVPLAWLFVAWGLMYFLMPVVLLQIQQLDGYDQRQASSVYWLDSDWLEVACILVTLLLFDLWDRRFAKAWALPLLAAIGAGCGYVVQRLLEQLGWDGAIGRALLRYQGDTTQYEPERLLTNWPNFLPGVSEHLGWGLGLLIGVAAYFVIWGQFRRGAALFLCMALGWFAGFLLFPVLLDIRLTPPRGDNWAGIVGTLAGAMLWCWRQKLPAIVGTALVCGTIGGIGFAGTAWLKLMLTAPGNPAIVSDPETVAAWAHWQSANWHSFLEQTYGLINGIALAVALGMLSARVSSTDNSTGPRVIWTEILAFTFALPILLYVNMVKNVNDWLRPLADGVQVVPTELTAPLFASWQMSTYAWFNLFFALGTVVLLSLVVSHRRRRIEIVPESWTGRGQLLLLVVMWAFVLGNWTKALNGFASGRLLTEGGVTLSALGVTLIVLLWPRKSAMFTPRPPESLRTWVGSAFLVMVLVAGILPSVATMTIRSVYGDAHAGHSGQNYRFGEKANWLRDPILLDRTHR